jgi:hypothetical protein
MLESCVYCNNFSVFKPLYLRPNFINYSPSAKLRIHFLFTRVSHVSRLLRNASNDPRQRICILKLLRTQFLLSTANCSCSELGNPETVKFLWCMFWTGATWEMIFGWQATLKRNAV